MVGELSEPALGIEHRCHVLKAGGALLAENALEFGPFGTDAEVAFQRRLVRTFRVAACR